MQSEMDAELTFDVTVERRCGRPSCSGAKPLPLTTLAYAVVSKHLRRQLRKRSFYLLVETYRSHFGIKSSYRQMNRARLRTSFHSPELRLLVVAFALAIAYRQA